MTWIFVVVEAESFLNFIKVSHTCTATLLTSGTQPGPKQCVWQNKTPSRVIFPSKEAFKNSQESLFTGGQVNFVQRVIQRHFSIYIGFNADRIFELSKFVIAHNEMNALCSFWETKLMKRCRWKHYFELDLHKEHIVLLISFFLSMHHKRKTFCYIHHNILLIVFFIVLR